MPLGRAGAAKGYLAVRLNTTLIKAKLRDSLLDVLTILVVSLVFGLELARMLSVFLHDADTEGQGAERNLQAIRVISFVFFFSALVPLSFLPGYIQELYQATSQDYFGISKEALLGFPISSYLLGVTIFIPIVGFLSTRWSTRSIFLIAGSLFAIGTFASAFGTGILTLSSARFMAGLGYGGMVINGSNLARISHT